MTCHYKNGALLFCTIDSFERDRACEIMELFIRRGLASALRPKDNNRYQVVGRLNLYYDPFARTSIKWGEVLERMNLIMQLLENDLMPFVVNNLNSNPGRYFHLRR